MERDTAEKTSTARKRDPTRVGRLQRLRVRLKNRRVKKTTIQIESFRNVKRVVWNVRCVRTWRADRVGPRPKPNKKAIKVMKWKQNKAKKKRIFTSSSNVKRAEDQAATLCQSGTGESDWALFDPTQTLKMTPAQGGGLVRVSRLVSPGKCFTVVLVDLSRAIFVGLWVDL